MLPFPGKHTYREIPGHNRGYGLDRHIGRVSPFERSPDRRPYIDHLPLEEKNLASALKEQGYKTYHVGKWHLGTSRYYPENQGFDKNIGGCHWGHPRDGYFSPYHIETLEDGPEGEYLTDRLTSEAIKLIRETDEPFFLNLWHYTVHTPIQAKEEDVKYFEKKARRLGLDHIDPFVSGEPFPTGHKRHLKVTRRVVQSDCTYAAMIKNLDDNTDRLLKALEETGKLENTVIIFTSDNGGLATSEGSPTCNHPASEGKGWMYEGGTRVPLSITYPPLIQKGTHSKFPTSSPDLFPTILDLAGASPDSYKDVDGVSLRPVLTGGYIKDRPLFWHYPHYGNQGGTPGSSIRYGKWKLIEFYEDMRYELYDLENDISETNDLSDSYPEKRDELKNLLEDWKKSIGAKIPKRNPDWKT